MTRRQMLAEDDLECDAYLLEDLCRASLSDMRTMDPGLPLYHKVYNNIMRADYTVINTTPSNNQSARGMRGVGLAEDLLSVACEYEGGRIASRVRQYYLGQVRRLDQQQKWSAELARTIISDQRCGPRT